MTGRIVRKPALIRESKFCTAKKNNSRNITQHFAKNDAPTVTQNSTYIPHFLATSVVFVKSRQ